MAPACFDMSHNSDHFSMMFQAHLIFFLSSPRISCFSKGSWSLLLEIVLEAKILVLIPTGVPLSLVFFFFQWTWNIFGIHWNIYVEPGNIGNNYKGPFGDDSENLNMDYGCEEY